MVKYMQVRDLFYGGIFLVCVLLASVSWDGFEPQPPAQLPPDIEDRAEVIVGQQKMRNTYQGLVHTAVFQFKEPRNSTQVQLNHLSVVWF